jgi:hypothetical protein
MDLALNGTWNELRLQIFSQEGIKRIYKISFEDESNILQADFSTEGLNLVSAPARMFQGRIIDNFASGLFFLVAQSFSMLH